MRILIIGATGSIGTVVMDDLIRQGRKPVAGVRTPEKARRQWSAAAEYAPFDFHDPATFPAALAGVDRLFLIAPHADPVPSVQGLLRAAAGADVQRVVFSSGRTTGDIEGKPLHQVEQTLRASGLPYTIVRPGWFMQNFLDWLGAWIPTEDKLYLPAGDSRTAFIDVRDIGAVVATLLTEHGHSGRTYELTSDEALDHYEVTRLIGEAIGKAVEYVPLKSDIFIELMVEKGWTRQVARHTAELYHYVRAGKEAHPSDDVATILGRAPIRFAQFVEDYRKRWAIRRRPGTAGMSFSSN